ncbi:hypothetical protein HW537_10955 [Asaia siamensis]
MRSAAEIFGCDIPVGAHIVREAGAVGGFLPITETQWEAHYATEPWMRGAKALSAFRRLLARFWQQFPTVRELIGAIKTDNRPARYLAVRLGFAFRFRLSLPWPDGVTRETAIYGMLRP